MKLFKKFFINAIKKTDLASALAVRLTQITGKSKVPIHPKHFLTQQPWFISYLKKSDKILDLGSGIGQNAIKAARFCKTVTGVEIDKDLIEKAKTSLINDNISNVKFSEYNLEEKLKFNDNSFDKIIFLDVLEHLHKREQILLEIKRVLKSQGLVLISVPNSNTSWKKFQRSAGICSYSDPDHKIEYSEKSIKDLLEKYNFRISEFGYDAFDIPCRGLVDVFGAFSLSFYKKISNWRIKRAQRFPRESGGFQIVAANIK